MDVGVNYPWWDYGWDFGDAPPGWRKDSEPNWAHFIDANLEYFHDLGIRVIRWFIFGDGLSYGSDKQAPQENTAGGWDFDPPDLSESFQKHFRKLLESFTEANKKWQQPIKILPVLLDFHLCKKGSVVKTADGRWIKCGRSKMVTDPEMSKKFYDGALKPLLDIAKEKDHRNAIFAWDIFNEPEWVTTDWHPCRDVKGLSVAAQQMRQFIMGAMDRVRSQDFKATIGFARIETIHSTKLYADYNQFHHYVICDKRQLPSNKFDKRWPGIVGEFASSLNNDHWAELSDNQTVCDRLKQIEKMGYPLALIWSAIANDNHTSWGEAEEGIKKYLGKK